jgi:hypothetical protein
MLWRIMLWRAMLRCVVVNTTQPHTKTHASVLSLPSLPHSCLSFLLSSLTIISVAHTCEVENEEDLLELFNIESQLARIKRNFQLKVCIPDIVFYTRNLFIKLLLRL